MDSTSEMRNIPFQEFYSTIEENMDIDLTTEVASTGTRYSFENSPGVETADFKTYLFAKYFELKSSLSEVYHYDVKVRVSFSQGGCKISQTDEQFLRNSELFSVPEDKCKEIIAVLLKFNKCEKFKYIYDGKKNLLTSIELPILRKRTITTSLAAEDKYEITIKPMKKYNGTNAITMTILQDMTLHSEDEVRNNLLELNNILEHRVNAKICFDSYSSILNVEKFDIGKGLEIWRGYEQRLNLTKSGPAYVLNVSELIFHKSGPVIDYINELLGFNITEKIGPLTPDEVKEIRNALCGLLVYATHIPYRRKYSIEDISDTAATDIILPTTEKVTSVAEYYEEKYCRLLFPHFPCLKMRSNSNYPVYIPLENCVIFEGQQKLHYQRTDTGDKLNALGNLASNVPNKHNDSFKKLGLFMDLNQKILHCQGICPPASKCVEGNPQFHNDFSRWGLQKKFSKLLKNDSWIVLSFVDETQLPLEKITEFLEQLKVVCSTVGLWFGKFLGIQIFGRDEPLDKALQRKEIKNATLAIILLSKTYSQNYDEIKFIADYRLGLITKCVRDDTIYALNERIARNICLSINTKLGGLTYELAQAPKMFSQPVIVFGAVVVRLKKDTIASVVGSLDAYPSRYQVSCRVQEEKNGKISKDYITDLENMAKAILNSFYHHTKGKYPEKIIFFRNNAILSNFKLLIYYEVKAIQKSCKDIVGHILPITFIVVSKHHHKSTKSVLQNKSGGARTEKNIHHGILIDTDINSSNVFIYTICNDLTDKPTYYYAIHDDNKFTAQELQELTHHMCYIHAGNRYISIPTPIRYAYRAAMRAKKYAHCQCSKYETKSDDLSDSTRDAINKMECNEIPTFFQ